MRQVEAVCASCPVQVMHQHNIRCYPIVWDGIDRMLESRPEPDIHEVPPLCPRYLEHLVLRQEENGQ